MPRRLPRAEPLAIAGPAGPLEALVEVPEGAAGDRFGVICHPHPLHGGTMHNKVVHTVARAFHGVGVPTVRFNFRGVGASAGSYGDGIGETEDALAVVEWGRARWPGASLWLAGFSFGGAVAIRAAQRARPERLVAVAPAVARLDAGEVDLPAGSWLIIQGEADEVIDHRTVLDWASRVRPAPQVKLLPGVSHFFHGRLHELQDAVTAFVQ